MLPQNNTNNEYSWKLWESVCGPWGEVLFFFGHTSVSTINNNLAHSTFITIFNIMASILCCVCVFLNYRWLSYVLLLLLDLIVCLFILLGLAKQARWLLILWVRTHTDTHTLVSLDTIHTALDWWSGCPPGWRVCAVLLQDDRAGMAGSVPKLGLPGLGDSHCSGE